MSSTPVLTTRTFVSKPVITTNLVSNAGWDQLAGSQFVDASKSFVNNIASNTKTGESRIGYALAMASSGDLDQGVWAMKRAFASNANEAGNMMLDEKLLPTVENVTRMYETRMDSGKTNDDDSFMLAALYQMQGDPEMASMAMDYIKVKNAAATNSLAALIETEMKSIPMTHGVGWDHLAAGRSNEAIDAFIAEINNDTQTGIPKLGFGLAYAELGDFKKASWAVKRAFEIDPDGVSDVMLDGNLRPILAKITQRFEKSEMSLDEDNALVLGTLYQLQGDLEGAEFVVKEGKVDPSIYAASMVMEEMKMQKEMMQKAMPEMMDTDENPPFYGPNLPPEYFVSEEKNMFEEADRSSETTAAIEPVRGEIIEVAASQEPYQDTDNIAAADMKPDLKAKREQEMKLTAMPR